MRMRLYAAEIVRPAGIINCHIVAPSGERATQFARDLHSELGIGITCISLSRIDDKLPPEQQHGLEDMLESAPIGFASQCGPIGWFVHSAMHPSLKLYRIEDGDGGVMQVVAPNPNAAAAIWLENIELDEDGCHPLWSISDGLQHLNDAQRKAMVERLESDLPVW